MENAPALPPPAVACLADINTDRITALLASFGVTLIPVPAGADIPASHWGAPEAGLTARGVHARPDTPVHSILHEAAHYICMPAPRRAALADNGNGDAGGDVAEEDAVCYLQILLGGELASAGFGRDRLLRDMDAWGYSFRLGSARHWFESDADEARAWLENRGLVAADGRLKRRDREARINAVVRSGEAAMRRLVPGAALVLALAGALMLTGAQAQTKPAARAPTAKSVVDSPRAIFDAEVCRVDGLTKAECDCAWTYLSGKLSAADLKLALLLTASNSDDAETVRQADIALDKSKVSDKRRDSMLSDFSGMVIDAEDACVK